MAAERSDTGASSRPVRVASLPPAIRQNPYQRLLYDHLRAFDVEAVEKPDIKLRWLWRSRRQVDVLHFHWPQPYYRHARGAEPLRMPLSYAKLALFRARLRTARILGYRIVWTVHELVPHETTSRRLDRLAAASLARRADVLIAHDTWTRDRIRDAMPSVASKIAVVHHGSYVGVYPSGRHRDEVRAELGVAHHDVLFICFGHLRAYKHVHVLLDAFRGVSRPEARLLVAGLPLDEHVAKVVRDAAAADPRILTLIGFVPDDGVAELFQASDVAIMTRADGGTSGALVLALSLGVPVIAAARPSYEQLTDGGRAGWHFEPDNVVELQTLLDCITADPESALTKAAGARTLAKGLSWEAVAAATAQLMKRRD
jgi:glycosyltransferase involved in cell wall biosynthesis